MEASDRALFYQELADLKARTHFRSTHPDPAAPSPHPHPEFLPYFLAFWKQLGVGLLPHNPVSNPGGLECMISPCSSGHVSTLLKVLQSLSRPYGSKSLPGYKAPPGVLLVSALPHARDVLPSYLDILTVLGSPPPRTY